MKFDFQDGNGPVPAHRHRNPDGFEGGWVADSAWVSGDAQVSGNARVYGDAWVSGDARVSGNAQVSGNARVYGDAWMYGDAWVSGDARVSGNALILHGKADKYNWTAFKTQGGSWFLAFGCESHRIEDWPALNAELAKKNEPDRADQFEAIIWSIIDMVCIQAEANEQSGG